MSEDVGESLDVFFDEQRMTQQAYRAYTRDVQKRVATISEFNSDITGKVGIDIERGLIDIEGVGSMLLFDELGLYKQKDAIGLFGIKLPESTTLMKLDSVVQSNIEFYRQILKMDGTTYYSCSNNGGGSALGLDIDATDYIGVRQQNGVIPNHVRLFHEYAS